MQGLREIVGDLLPPAVYEDLARDRLTAPMGIGLTPHWLAQFQWDDFTACPLRRYTLPLASERRTPPSHPLASHDILQEEQSMPLPGLIRRYRSSALILLSHQCPTLCAHCSRMRRVGPGKRDGGQRSLHPGGTRFQQMLDYIRRDDRISDLLLSGGDLAAIPIQTLHDTLSALLDLPSLREIRLATKALTTLPQWLLQPRLLDTIHRLCQRADERGVRLTVQTQINHPQAISPESLVACDALRQAGIHEIRNQAVLLRGVNHDASTLKALHDALLRRAGIRPYYVFLCEVVPGSEHWRLPMAQALRLAEQMHGWLPGHSSPRFTVDLPVIGKHSVFQRAGFLAEQGISWWSGRPGPDATDPDEPRLAIYPDPLDTLPPAGRRAWLQEPDRTRRAVETRLRSITRAGVDLA